MKLMGADPMNAMHTAALQPQLLSAFSEDQRAAALARFEQLRPALEDNVPLARLALELHMPRRTVQLWVTRYRRQGLSGLVRGQRSDRGHHRLRPGLRDAIEGLALQRPPRSLASIQRQVAGIAWERGWAEPSYRIVHSVIRQLDPSLVRDACLRSALRSALSPRSQSPQRAVARRPHTPRPMDRRRARAASPSTAHGRHRRLQPSHSGLSDRASCAFGIVDSPRATPGHLAQRRSALDRVRHPRRLLHRPRQRLHLASPRTGGRRTQHASSFSIAGAPRRRGKVERFYGTVNQRLLCDLPGYTPAGTGPPAKPVLTLGQLDSRFRTWLVDEHHQDVHSE